MKRIIIPAMGGLVTIPALGQEQKVTLQRENVVAQENNIISWNETNFISNNS